MIERISTSVFDMTFRKWGLKHQMVVAMEELSELMQAISKAYRNKTNQANLIEEMADVLICVQTMAYAFGITNEQLQHAANCKIERLNRMLLKGDPKYDDGFLRD